MVLAEDGAYYGKHPIGYVLLCAAAYRIGGPDAPFLVNPLLAALALVGVFALGRLLAGPLLGVAAALLLAANPLHGMFALSAMSHTASVAAAVWGLTFAFAWRRNGGVGSAALAGALCAFAASVRYAEVFLALPLAALVAQRLRALASGREPGRSAGRTAAELAAMAAAALLAIAPLLVHQWRAYGSPFLTGQSLTHGTGGAFAWSFVPRNTALLFSQLRESGLLAPFLAGVAGLAALLRLRPADAIPLGLWALPTFFVYGAYFWRTQGDYAGDLRFYLSAFPPLALAAVTALAHVPRPRDRAVAAGLLLAVVVPIGAQESAGRIAAGSDLLSGSRQMRDALREALPDGAAVFTDEPFIGLLQYTGDYRVYYDALFHPSYVGSYLPWLERPGPSIFPRSRIRRLAALLGGRSAEELAGAQRALVAGHLVRGRPVFFATGGHYVQEWRQRLGGRFEIVPVFERRLYWDARDPRFPSRRIEVFALRSIDDAS